MSAKKVKIVVTPVENGAQRIFKYLKSRSEREWLCLPRTQSGLRQNDANMSFQDFYENIIIGGF